MKYAAVFVLIISVSTSKGFPPPLRSWLKEVHFSWIPVESIYKTHQLYIPANNEKGQVDRRGGGWGWEKMQKSSS